MKLLVTGFGPFPGVHHNPSGQIALAMGQSARLKRLGIRVAAHELIVTYAALPDLVTLIAREKPDAIMMFGIAARSQQPRLERRGENRTRPLSVDASGQKPPSRKLDPSAPLIRPVRAALEPLRLAIARQGFRPTLSNNAGAYLCNAVLFTALGQRPDAPCIFIHVPKLSRQGISRMAKAGDECALLLLAQARRQRQRAV
jgi:pyroglutamyl-peptidase